MPDELLTVTQAEVMRFCDEAFRNMNLSRLHADDVKDIAGALQTFARHRQSQPEPLAGQGEIERVAVAKGIDEYLAITGAVLTHREMRGPSEHDLKIGLAEHIADAILASLQSGGQSERGMIVDWLRETAAIHRSALPDPRITVKARHHMNACEWAADAIERGDFLPNPKGEG